MNNHDKSLLALLAKRVGDVSKHEGPQGVAGAVGATGPQGEQGERGPQGEQGERGAKGANGEQGEQGERGPQGEQGERGAKGAKGDKGDRGEIGLRGRKGEQGERGVRPRHEWRGSKLRFEQPDGEWGKWVDLKGEKGNKGEEGRVIVSGGGGGSSFKSYLLPIAAPVLTDYVVIEREGSSYRVSLADIKVLFLGEIPETAVTVNGDYVKVNAEYVTAG